MDSNWIYLSDIASISSGGTPSKNHPEYWNGDIPWVSAKSMDADSLNSSMLYITNEGVSAGSCMAKPGDILLLVRGSGLFKRIPIIWVDKAMAFNQDIKRLSVPDHDDARYLYFWLQSQRSVISQNLEMTGIGAGKIDMNYLSEMPVWWPDKTVRKRIVVCLDSMQKLRTCLTQTNGHLLELLMTEYRNVINSIDTYGCIEDLGTVVGGATPSKKREEFFTTSGISWVTPKDLSNTTNIFIEHGATDITDAGHQSCSTKLMPAGSVLFSSRAPVGYVAIAAKEVCTNQGFKSVVPSDNIGTAFVFCFLRDNAKEIEKAGSGTTFVEVSGRAMRHFAAPIPSAEQARSFSSYAGPLLDAIKNNENEIAALAQLRDALLLKLMSGEIDVSKIELPTTPEQIVQTNGRLSE
ncbi:restriction endonuclease subunit S [Bifidobacterium imperatoris]|uniref:Restriction endonuclease subunit S n=1 Tax=Bifidobacterium imperatoris TaxID=2020965 RepID=A0ABX7RZB4_9BIFI|nr:restriction endonuclease subunit S [Bifidobacterium imperatoris]QSY57334.1 restriction endonuclease subunit S [Bifidobacterium imperatoris]